MASCAARLISAGAEKSGNPCARLTAPYCMACRVISRITDSVKCSTLSERKYFGREETCVMESKASTRDACVGTDALVRPAGQSPRETPRRREEYSHVPRIGIGLVLLGYPREETSRGRTCFNSQCSSLNFCRSRPNQWLRL